jgi:hypothetical protein
MNSTQILRIRNQLRFKCPFANCMRWFKSPNGLTYHTRTQHTPSDPLALTDADAILESDEYISALRDQSSDNSEPNFEPNPWQSSLSVTVLLIVIVY